MLAVQATHVKDRSDFRFGQASAQLRSPIEARLHQVETAMAL